MKNIKRVEVWGEGALGKVHLEIKEMRLSPKTAQLGEPTQSNIRPSPDYDMCQDGVQDRLNFGINHRQCAFGCETPDMPIAESVCCDTRNLAFAEPQFLFEAPDINLFNRLDSSKVTTFYDSVCGVPLFKAPIGRSFDEWKAETEEHGWPSFRTQEIISENIVVDKDTGLVSSSCGTHLGTYLPDQDEKPRYCIDLSCIAGSEASMTFLQ